ncbi:MAG TPA: DUF448 domain-containing protein [Candidatus Cloacimonadota bacterium]|nr:DUF448 domain-containing protein [Candidatus Cloacimonadota bacterium]HPS39419.1 DUF448 domain-containing protein [Candidatus Cloacimonadota bacterium]
MPNRNSHADHIPFRTCVICRRKAEQKSLWSIRLLPQGLVIDLKRELSGRKCYVCPESDCLSGLERWQKKYSKKYQASVTIREIHDGNH